MFYPKTTKNGAAYLCLHSDEEILLDYTNPTIRENGEVKRPGWGMVGGKIVKWSESVGETLSSLTHCEDPLETILRKSFEKSSLFFLNDDALRQELENIATTFFKTFSDEENIRLWNEYIPLIHLYAEKVRVLNIFEDVITDEAREDRGPVHVFPLHAQKLKNFNFALSASARNDFSCHTKEVRWWEKRGVARIVSRELGGEMVARDSYIYKSHGKRMKKLGVI